MYHRLVKHAAATGLALLVANALANKFYWYTSVFGFDKVMHTGGGVFIVFVVCSFWYKKLSHLNPKELFITLALAVFVVGLVWEYYEYVVQMYVKSVHLADVPDSIGDLIFDMIGGVLGASFVISSRKRYNTE